MNPQGQVEVSDIESKQFSNSIKDCKGKNLSKSIKKKEERKGQYHLRKRKEPILHLVPDNDKDIEPAFKMDSEPKTKKRCRTKRNNAQEKRRLFRKFTLGEDERKQHEKKLYEIKYKKFQLRKKLNQSGDYVNFILNFYKEYGTNEIKIDFTTKRSIDVLVDKFRKIELKVKDHEDYHKVYEKHNSKQIKHLCGERAFHSRKSRLRAKLNIDFLEEKRILQAYKSLGNNEEITLDYKNDSWDDLVRKFSEIKKSIGEPIDKFELLTKCRKKQTLNENKISRTNTIQNYGVRKKFNMSLEEFNNRIKNFKILKNDELLDASETLSTTQPKNIPESTEELEPNEIDMIESSTSKNWFENMSTFFGESEIFNTEWKVFKEEKNSILQKIANNSWIITKTKNRVEKNKTQDLAFEQCLIKEHVEGDDVFYDEGLDSLHDYNENDILMSEEDNDQQNKFEKDIQEILADNDNINCTSHNSQNDGSLSIEKENKSSEKDISETNITNEKEPIILTTNIITQISLKNEKVELLKIVEEILDMDIKTKKHKKLENIFEKIATSIQNMNSIFMRNRNKTLTSSEKYLLSKIRHRYIPQDVPHYITESLKQNLTKSQYDRQRRHHIKLDAFKTALINQDPDFNFNLLPDEKILQILKSPITGKIFARRNKEFIESLYRKFNSNEKLTKYEYDLMRKYKMRSMYYNNWKERKQLGISIEEHRKRKSLPNSYKEISIIPLQTKPTASADIDKNSTSIEYQRKSTTTEINKRFIHRKKLGLSIEEYNEKYPLPAKLTLNDTRIFRKKRKQINKKDKEMREKMAKQRVTQRRYVHRKKLDLSVIEYNKQYPLNWNTLSIEEPSDDDDDNNEKIENTEEAKLEDKKRRKLADMRYRHRKKLGLSLLEYKKLYPSKHDNKKISEKKQDISEKLKKSKTVEKLNDKKKRYEVKQNNDSISFENNELKDDISQNKSKFSYESRKTLNIENEIEIAKKFRRKLADQRFRHRKSLGITVSQYNKKYPIEIPKEIAIWEKEHRKLQERKKLIPDCVKIGVSYDDYVKSFTENK